MATKKFIRVTPDSIDMVLPYLKSIDAHITQHWVHKLGSDTNFTLYIDKHHYITWSPSLREPKDYIKGGYTYVYVEILKKIYLGGE